MVMAQARALPAQQRNAGVRAVLLCVSAPSRECAMPVAGAAPCHMKVSMGEAGKDRRKTMPAYIDTASLNALTEAELNALWRIISDEMAAMPEGSEARAAAYELLGRIRAVIAFKRRMCQPSL